MKIACSMLVLVLLAAPAAHAQFGGAFGTAPEDAKAGRAPISKDAAPDDAAQTTAVQRWKIGFSVRAENANCGGIFATLPVPANWPEQSVRIVDELTDVSPQVKKVAYRELGGGVRQMLVTIPFLSAGDEAHVYMTFEVAKRMVLAPADVKALTIPPNVPRPLRVFLGISPKIESTNKKIERQADEIVADKEGAWEKVEAIYDWVREHVEYKDGPLKGALAALNDGDGDCEELTSLFVAMCRAIDVPARTVWVEGHCYPEFYLLDGQGKGQWIPCQAAGTRSFGSLFDKRPILQKGDNFKVPEKKDKQRYVAEFLSAKSVAGSGGPKVTFTRELALDKQPVARFR